MDLRAALAAARSLSGSAALPPSQRPLGLSHHPESSASCAAAAGPWTLVAFGSGRRGTQAVVAAAVTWDRGSGSSGCISDLWAT